LIQRRQEERNGTADERRSTQMKTDENFRRIRKGESPEEH
jgi:hypothetical protein